MSPFSRVPFFESFFDTRFNSLSHISWSNVSILCVIWKKKVFISLRHIQRKGFNSLRHIQRKRVQLFAYLKKGLKSLTHIKKFNSLSHTKKTPILWLILNKKVQFFEPYLKKSSILWVLKKSVLRVKKGSILWVMFLFESDIFKKVPFFE